MERQEAELKRQEEERRRQMERQQWRERMQLHQRWQEQHEKRLRMIKQEDRKRTTQVLLRLLCTIAVLICLECFTRIPLLWYSTVHLPVWFWSLVSFLTRCVYRVFHALVVGLWFIITHPIWMLRC